MYPCAYGTVLQSECHLHCVKFIHFFSSSLFHSEQSRYCQVIYEYVSIILFPLQIPAITKPVLKAAKSFNFASPKPGTTKTQTFNFASPKPTKATMPTNPKSVNPKTVSFKVSKLKAPKKVILPSSVAAPAIDKRKATPGVRKSISALTPGSGVRKSIGGATPVKDRKSLGGVKTPSRKSVGGKDERKEEKKSL